MDKEADTSDEAANLTLESVSRSVENISLEASKIDTSNPGRICLCCGKKTGLERRWCDAICRDSWQLGELL